MPAIIAHHLFGEEVYGKLVDHIGRGDDERAAFLLGNQGPDPLFSLKGLPSSVPYRNLGTIMHQSRADGLFAQMRDVFFAADSASRAFALGFLCHYVLDSTVHPLVYAQQYALVDAGVEGLAREQTGGAVHALIETEFDEYLLTKQRGVTVREFVPHRETLRCPQRVLDRVSLRMSSVVAGAYGIEISRSVYASSVIAYRAAQVAIDSKRDGLRRYIDYARLVGSRYPHLLALTHVARTRMSTMFANDAHEPWPHPFEPDSVITESFDELYDAACVRACALIPVFVAPGFSVGECEELASGVNFRGQRV